MYLLCLHILVYCTSISLALRVTHEHLYTRTCCCIDLTYLVILLIGKIHTGGCHILF